MARKTCIPGLFCIENMTFFLLFVLLLIMVYLYHTNIVKAKSAQNASSNAGGQIIQPVVFMTPPVSQQPDYLAPISARQDTVQDTLQNDYAPPLQNMEFVEATHGLPVNIKTQGYAGNYSQIGILTRKSGKEQILPLMGRKSTSARDKYQCYTMTNSAGNINTKLPVSVNGRSCTSEMGCDEIHNGDNVYVEGFHDTFHATIYENRLFQYIPYL